MGTNIDLNKRPLLKLWLDFKYYVSRSFFKKSLLERVALHESAHIVFSYFYGFKVTQSRLFLDKPGNGFTETQYGKEKAAANIIFKLWFDQFQQLSQEQQRHVIRLAHYFLVILFAGSCAEAFAKKKSFDKNYRLEVSGEDLDEIQILEQFLTTLRVPYNADLTAKRTFEFFENYPIFNQTIKEMAKEFKLSNNYSLNQAQIEKVLKDTDFKNETDKIIQNKASG